MDDVMDYMDIRTEPDLCTDSEQDTIVYSEPEVEEIPTINDFDEY